VFDTETVVNRTAWQPRWCMVEPTHGLEDPGVVFDPDDVRTSS